MAKALRFGSCNAQEFMVHEDCMRPEIAGSELESQKQIWYFGRRNDDTNIGLLRATSPGQHWGWRYTAEHDSPGIRVIRQSDDIPLYIWEAESRVDEYRLDYIPLLETDEYGRSVIPSGGSAVWMIFPPYTALQTIQTDVEAASLPGWASDTIWSNLTTTKDLLRATFVHAQSRTNKREFQTIDEVMERLMRKRYYQIYVLIWMRQASRILYEHYGQSCIPLILNRFSIDEYGSVTLR